VVDAQFCLRQVVRRAQGLRQCSAGDEAFRTLATSCARSGLSPLPPKCWPLSPHIPWKAAQPCSADGGVHCARTRPTSRSYDWKIERIVLPDGAFSVVCYFYDDLTNASRPEKPCACVPPSLRPWSTRGAAGHLPVDAQFASARSAAGSAQNSGDIREAHWQRLAAVMLTLWGPARADEIDAAVPSHAQHRRSPSWPTN
jgi:hypothetical protein